MTAWDAAALAAFDAAEEVVLVLSREGHDDLDVPVWLVVVDGAVYVRSYLGTSRRWFRRVEARHDQAITLNGTRHEVRFEDVERTDHVNAAISAAYDTKYATFDYRDAMSEPAAVEATLRVAPRS